LVKQLSFRINEGFIHPWNGGSLREYHRDLGEKEKVTAPIGKHHEIA